jgi:hypothetical protein
MLEKEGPMEGKRLDGKTKCRKMPPNCSVRKTYEKRQDIGMTGGIKLGRSWPANGTICRTKKKYKPCCT